MNNGSDILTWMNIFVVVDTLGNSISFKQAKEKIDPQSRSEFQTQIQTQSPGGFPMPRKEGHLLADG